MTLLYRAGYSEGAGRKIHRKRRKKVTLPLRIKKWGIHLRPLSAEQFFKVFLKPTENRADAQKKVENFSRRSLWVLKGGGTFADPFASERTGRVLPGDRKRALATFFEILSFQAKKNSRYPYDQLRSQVETSSL